MFAGIAGRLKRTTNASIVCNLSGEDLFLDSLLDTQLGDLTQNAIGGSCSAIETGQTCGFGVFSAVPEDSNDPIDPLNRRHEETTK